jgi:hypothetical protein
MDGGYTAALLARSGISCKPIILEGETAVVRQTSLERNGRKCASEEFNEEYVRNDVSLDDETSHILLYGINSSGKSTILRGVGLSIMVQASCMHRVGACIYVLSKNRYARILTDNIERSQFVQAEVHEMRETLRQQDLDPIVGGRGCVTGINRRLHWWEY